MINHYGPGNVASNFDAVVHPRDMAYQQGDQNTEAARPRTGLKYLTERMQQVAPRPWPRVSAAHPEFAGP
jgi:hypothetical protein